MDFMDNCFSVCLGVCLISLALLMCSLSVGIILHLVSLF